jgi:hypothetical protein
VYSNVELFRGKHHKTSQNITKHSTVICLCYCSLAIICVLKILKKLGQEAVLFTEEEIRVAFLAFE